MSVKIVRISDRVKSSTKPLAVELADHMAADCATAAAVHVHLFAKFLLETGRPQLAQPVMDAAEIIENAAKAVRGR